jgi:hypothetical protein
MKMAEQSQHTLSTDLPSHGFYFIDEAAVGLIGPLDLIDRILFNELSS